MILTSSAQLQFSAGLRTLLVVAYETLIHAVVLLFHRLDAKYGVAVANRFAVLEPGHRFDGIALEVAREYGRPAEVDGLRGWVDFGRERSGHCQHSFDTLAANRIIDNAQIFARILDDRVLYDQCARHLLHAIVQYDGLLTR